MDFLNADLGSESEDDDYVPDKKVISKTDKEISK